MNEFLEIGLVNTLKIDRKSDHGLYLISKSGEDVLLPNQYVDDSMKLGELLDVFIYRDSEDRLIATTLHPKALLGEFAYMEVVDSSSWSRRLGIAKESTSAKEFAKDTIQIGMKSLFRVC